VRHARPPRTRWCRYHSRLSYILHTPVLLSATPAAAACFAKTRALRSLGDNPGLEMGGNHPHDADVNLPQVVRVSTLTPRLLWPGCSLSSEREITLFTRRINPLALRPRVPRRGDAHALAYMTCTCLNSNFFVTLSSLQPPPRTPLHSATMLHRQHSKIIFHVLPQILDNNSTSTHGCCLNTYHLTTTSPRVTLVHSPTAPLQ